MRNSLQFIIAGILLSLCGLLLSSCATIQSTAAENAVKDTFYKWRECIIKGQWQEAYNLTSTRLKSLYDNSYEKWKTAYADSELKALLLEIKEVKDIFVDETGASILVSTGGKPRVFTADDENGVWKISGMARTPK